MTPEDWERGLKNEAASVQDTAWAGETRRAALLSGLSLSTALYAVLAAAHLGVLAALHSRPDVSWLWVNVMVAISVMGVVLGSARVSRWSVFLGALLYLPAVWLGVVALQVFGYAYAPLSPGIPDEAIFILPVLALSSAILILMLRRLRAFKA